MKDRSNIDSAGSSIGVRIQQASAIVFMAGSALYLFEAHKYPYADYLGPGAGFFPFWIGLIGLLTGGALLVTANSQQAKRSASTPPTPSARSKIILTIGLLGLAALALERLGFRPTAFLLILALLYAYGSSWWASLIAAAVASLLVFFLFHALGMQLPVNAFGF